ncbi:MAG TPA: serine hydrolase domain-containing protein [Isosphaeraceae bacterium]|jgi:CubicO group peptidase (beta-lactamase class C family)|nr:serine hydrolase domain-containing protein [Isosphaeraceae bacterium]
MRSLHIAATILSILGVFALPTAGADKATEPPKTWDAGAVDAYVAGWVKREEVGGLGLAVVRDGKVVLARGYGRRSLEGGQPVEPETSFAIGSVTKQFVCASVLLLAEEGKLSVDDPVSKYFPDLTRAGDITLAQLMSHTSGYPDYYPLDFIDRRMARTIEPDALIRKYASGPLDFPPGTRWSYSNTGYILLGRVVEKAGGMPLGRFLETRLLKPAGMTTAALDPEPSAGASTRARGSTSFALGPAEPAVPEGSGWLVAAGGLWASAPDLARWDLALMEGKLLKPESFRRMTTPVTLKDGRTRNYGFGVVVDHRDGETILAHGGAVSGFRATNIVLPRTKSAVVVLTNSEGAGASRLANDLAALLIRDEAPPGVPKVAGPTAKQATLAFFHALQAGEIDRKTLGEEFSVYLNDARVRDASARLKLLGDPSSVAADDPRERGGMEVTPVHLTFPTIKLRGLLYRSPDGKIQQLLFEKE